jgi:hypothetical protein
MQQGELAAHILVVGIRISVCELHPVSASHKLHCRHLHYMKQVNHITCVHLLVRFFGTTWPGSHVAMMLLIAANSDAAA